MPIKAIENKTGDFDTISKDAHDRISALYDNAKGGNVIVLKPRNKDLWDNTPKVINPLVRLESKTQE